jgi:pyrroloquinoline quinone (PQQ) biosynthesis protein C
MATAEATSQQRFVDELFRIMEEANYRDPMFNAIRAGRMSREGIKLWTLQAMFVVRQFTRFISAIHANCPHRDAQALLAENLWEEHGRGGEERDHYSLAKRMAKSLGASDEEISLARPLPETADYINYCFKITRDGSFIEAMAAIGLGIEYYMPVFFGVMAESLRTNYGLASEDIEYLSVHIEDDEAHARRSLEMIEKYSDTDEVKERAKCALGEMLAVKRRFAESLYAHCSSAAA